LKVGSDCYSDVPSADFHKAHTAAYFDAGVLHRDISAGNIMITDVLDARDETGGLLIDWDLSAVLDDSKHSKRIRKRRTASPLLVTFT
jgi:RIO-like serine/threonine protein kinase